MFDGLFKYRKDNNPKEQDINDPSQDDFVLPVDVACGFSQVSII